MNKPIEIARSEYRKIRFEFSLNGDSLQGKNLLFLASDSDSSLITKTPTAISDDVAEVELSESDTEKSFQGNYEFWIEFSDGWVRQIRDKFVISNSINRPE